MKASWVAALALLCLAGCEKAVRNMYDGARDKPLRASTRFEDGAGSRPQVEGTVERTRGVVAGTSSGRAGGDAEERRFAAERAATFAHPPALSLLRRGHERFDIYCAPCHSVVGEGDGMVVRRGFPRPPSFHDDRLRAASDRHLYDVISQGFGVMYSYADRVSPEDRWAIVAYVRALQLSQDAPRAQPR